MKTMVNVALLFSLGALFGSCKKESKPVIEQKDEISYTHVNKEFTLKRDVKEISTSKDPISLHVDSILKGLINSEVISTGLQSFDLNGDGRTDIGFEIIDLNKFNKNKLPVTFDSLAARVLLPASVQILDNSTYHYPDALNGGAVISGEAHWSGTLGVLGTFLTAGQFKGKGDKFLGFRFNSNYGWIKLNCSAHNDSLKIMEFAYNKTAGRPIKAGQKE